MKVREDSSPIAVIVLESAQEIKEFAFFLRNATLSLRYRKTVSGRSADERAVAILDQLDELFALN